MFRPIVFALVPLLVLAGCQAECESCGPKPELALFSPEPLITLPLGATEVGVGFEVTELTLDPGDEVVDGQGKVALALDAVPDAASDLVTAEPSSSFALPADLTPGPHRILGQLVQGDGTPYENPEAIDHSVFFVEDSNPDRPQVAFAEPRPFIEHVVGEPLEIRVGVHDFEIVANGEGDMECSAPDDCDPFDLAGECLSDSPSCVGLPVSTFGHVKVYLRNDFPGCLSDTPVDCNGDYIALVRPTSGSSTDVTYAIPGELLANAGTFTLSAVLSYNYHQPYPNEQFLIYDQITIELVER